MAAAVRSSQVASSPLSRTSACCKVTVSPGSPRTLMRTRPVRFCPKSTTVTSVGDCSMATGRNVSMRRTGGPVGATSRSCRPTPSSWTAIQSVSSKPGCRPRRFGQSGVVRLAVVQARREALVEGRPPLAIRHHDVGAAVVVVQFELGDRADVGAVGVAPSAAEAEPAPVPAFGDGHPEDVVTDLQRLGDVERLVAEPMAVRRPARGEDVVAEWRAVAGDGVDAERRGVQPGARQAGADGEAAPEPDRPLGGGVREGGGDRHRRPVLRVQQGDLDRRAVRSSRRIRRRVR